MPEGKKPGLFRNLGAFVGHITKAVNAPVGPTRKEVARTVEEAETTAPDGTPVKLRRTTIDEIETSDRELPGSGSSSSSGA